MITKKQRKEVEFKIYKTLDIIDPTEANSNWFKEKFSRMSDKEFEEYFTQEWPIKFQMKLFEIEPKMNQIQKALKSIGVPLFEHLYQPYLYTDKNGKPVRTNYEAIIVYIPIKKMKQFISKKNSMSINIDERNLKTGRLINKDKNANTSDREMECLAVMSLPNTMREVATYRADAVQAKEEFYNTINAKNMVSLKDVEVGRTDSISRNTFNTYLLGAGMMSNLITDTYYLPITLNKKDRVKREY